jgi:hypothetical protein
MGERAFWLKPARHKLKKSGREKTKARLSFFNISVNEEEVSFGDGSYL